MSCVLDASMTLSFVLADEFTSESEGALEAVARAGGVVPGHWDAEVLNGLRGAERRGRLSEAAVMHALTGLSRLPIERDRRAVVGEHVLALTRQHGLSAYDACYLHLAIMRDLPLATRDAALAGAAVAAGVPLLV